MRSRTSTSSDHLTGCRRGTAIHGTSRTGRRDRLATGLAVVMGLWLVLGPAPGHARPDDDVDVNAPQRPWFEGVDLEQRQTARERFLEGNRLLQIPAFARAAEEYQRAIAIWKHPAFYYNLVIAQLSLVQPLEAYASIREALRYGPGPLGEDKYRQALEYQERLEEQLVRVTIRCDEPGVEVTVDGTLVFVGPGRREHVLLPGSHQILGRKPGRIPETRQIVLAAGEEAEVELVLAMPDTIETERYLAGWIPWVSLGAGAALVTTAGYLDWHSSRELEAFDTDFNALCRRGCIEDQVPALSARLDRAESRKRAALALYIAGGATVIGSAILVYMNRERVVRTPAERRAGRADITVTPILSPDSAGISARWQF